MKITLVSHASLLVETNGVRILTDPWYEGTIYNNAWALCPEPPKRPDYTTLDALFISHAHPDHFEMRTLEKIRDARGADLPVYVAMFFFDTMKRALREAGFRRVIEMAPGREFSPFPRVRFYSQQFRLDDSLLVIAGEGDETLANINDTPLRGRVLADLARRYPTVDYVTAQFAIAQGYPYCYEGVEADFTRDDLIRRFDSYAQVLRPRHMIPFASFVRFCNADNAHMNAHKTTLADLQQQSAVPLTVLYPGDSIDRGNVSHDPAHRAHFEAAQEDTSVVATREAVSRQEMDVAMQQFTASLARRAPAFLRRKLPPFGMIVTDGDYGYRIVDGRATPATVAELDEMPIRYRMAGEVLYDSIRFDWGWADLSIGARFRATVEPGWQARELWFWIIPMLAGEGYLELRTLWFLRPRSIRVLWGRRLEFWDYVRSMVSGRFMMQVVRKKTSAVAAKSG